MNKGGIQYNQFNISSEYDNTLETTVKVGDEKRS